VTVIETHQRFTTIARGNQTFPSPSARDCNTFTTAPLSGTYEVTATRDGDWHISDLWLTLDNDATGCSGRTIEHRLKPGTPLWHVVVDLIIAHDREAIKARIAKEGSPP
jgi:hypothetical protein